MHQPSKIPSVRWPFLRSVMNRPRPQSPDCMTAGQSLHSTVHTWMQVQEDLLEVSWGSAVLALEPCRTVLAGKNEVGAQSHHVWQRLPCSTPQPSAYQCRHAVALLRWLQTVRAMKGLAVTVRGRPGHPAGLWVRKKIDALHYCHQQCLHDSACCSWL